MKWVVWHWSQVERQYLPEYGDRNAGEIYAYDSKEIAEASARLWGSKSKVEILDSTVFTKVHTLHSPYMERFN